MAGFNSISKNILLNGGYTRPGESIEGMFRRVAYTLATYSGDSGTWYSKFYDVLTKRWLCAATPVLTNTGHNINELPVSCFLTRPDDSIVGIYETLTEAAVLTKNGGGVGVHFDAIRPRGSMIATMAKSTGIVPWMANYGEMFNSVTQGNTRRGAGAVYFDIESPDFFEAIKFRRHKDYLHLGINIGEDFIKKCKQNKGDSRSRWEALMKERIETGEPYIFFIDRANAARPRMYRQNLLHGSNICSEITTMTNEHYTGTCVLSSLNLAKYDEWKNTDLPAIGIKFLDCVNKHFIEKAKNKPYLKKAVKYAQEYKSLGLGVLGWHSYLQQNLIPWESFEAMQHNNLIFKNIKEQAETMRDGHAHLLAIAPTRTNSIIMNQVSQGIQPIHANIYKEKTAKGEFIWKNKCIEKYIKGDKNTAWNEIEINGGSVQGLDHILDPEYQKIFKNFVEIDQKTVLMQADQRQKYICQSQSLNLMFSNKTTEREIHDVHWYAAVECTKIKSLYYCHSQAVSKVEYNKQSGCLACEG